MLGDKICNTQCNTNEFNYDNWDCTCAPGCTNDMRTNQVCDPKCYSKSCNYVDAKFCLISYRQCEVGCMENYQYDYCNWECLTWNCFYNDNNQCDYRIKSHAFYTQLITADKKTSVDIYSSCLKDAGKDMLDGKTAYCTLSKLGDGKCNPECNNLNCTYDLGDCSADCHETCGLCFGPKDSKKCMTCKPGTYLLYTACYESCLNGFEPKFVNGIDVCNEIKTVSRVQYDLFYITQDNSIPYNIQTGEKSSPFSYISGALANLRKKIGFIYLTNHDDSYHLLEPADKTKFPGAAILSRDDRPLDFGGFVKIMRLEIAPLVCSRRFAQKCYNGNAKVRWNGLRSIQLDVFYMVTIVNIDISGYNSITLESCPLTEYFQYCTYCQHVSFDYDNYANLDDHGNEITWRYAEESDCERYQDATLFKVHPGATLEIENSKIYDWRAGFNSIISNTQGNVQLTSVKFENINLTTAKTSAVIFSNECSENSYRCGEVVIKGSEVSMLNNGFEYNPEKSFSGFLFAKGLYKLEIENSKFSFNLAYDGEHSYIDRPSIGSLIYLDNFLIIKITNSEFDSNIMNHLIYLNMRSLYEQGYDTNLKSYHPNLDHIIFQNLTFSYNSGSLIVLNLEDELPNLVFSNITSHGNISASNLISVSSSSYKSSYQYDRSRVVIKNRVRTEYTLKKRTASLLNITFYSTYTPNYLLSSSNIGNIVVKSLNISNSIQHSNPDFSYMESLVYSKFRNNPLSYIKQEFKHQDLQYLYGVGNACYLGSIRNLTLENVLLKENYSYKAGVAIEVIDPSFSARFSRLNILSNHVGGEMALTGLSVNDYSSNITLSQIIAKENISSHLSSYGVIRLEAKTSCMKCIAEASDIIFERNSAGYLGSLSGIVSQIKVIRVEFLSNVLSSGYGGGLYLSTQGVGDYSIEITECIFMNNQILSGKGGAIAIDNTYNTNEPLYISIKNTTLSSNTSLKDASSLYISKSVKLTQDSIIKDCKFIGNKSYDKGNVYLEYYYGILTFQTCIFSENEGRQGIGIYYDINSSEIIDESDLCKLILKDCILDKNTAPDQDGALIHTPDTELYSILETQFCKFTNNRATILNVKYGKLSDTGSLFTNNTAYHASILSIQYESYASIDSVIIQENTSIASSGAFQISDSASVLVRNSKISNNRSGSNGGVIFMKDNSIIMIENSSIFQNSASIKGSVIYSTGCTKPGSYISNSKIYQNYSNKGGCIYLLNSYLNISNSEIYENKDISTSAGIIINLSTLNINFTTISNQSAHSGAAIYAMTDSEIRIDNSIFKNLHASSNGGFLYSYGNRVDISNSVIQDTSASSGGAIFANIETTLSLVNTEILNSISIEKGGAIYSQSSEVDIRHSTFNEFEPSAVEGLSLKKLEVSESTFKSNQNRPGAGIICEDCQDTVISSSSFLNLSSSFGGGIYANINKESQIRTSIIIDSCEFIDNKAMKGGAIYSDNVNITVSNSYFSNNTAYSPDDAMNDYGEGGAISVQCLDFEFCKFVLDSNIFEYNHAYRAGGAIIWKHFIPQYYHNIFRNNTALQGNNLSSPTVMFQYYDENSPLKFSRFFVTKIYSLVQLDEIPPGQKSFNINIALLDTYQNVATSDSSSIGELISKDPSVIISGITKVIANRGIFTFDDYIISAKPGSHAYLEFHTNAIDDSNFKMNEIMIPDYGVVEVNMRKCKLGEKRTEDKCIRCPMNTYSLDPEDDECKECPSEAICYGDYYIVPKEKYWRPSMYSEKFMKCPKESSCLGSDQSSLVYIGSCEEGYRDNLCQSCDIGFYRSSKNTCDACPDKKYNTLKVVLILLVVISLMIWIVRSTMRSVSTTKSNQSIYFKIFINYLQLISILAGLELNWPDFVKVFLSVQENSGNISELIISIDCILYDEGYAYNNESLYYFKLIMMFTLPFLLMLVSIIVWLSVSCYHRKFSYLKEELVSTIIILLFLIHPSVVNYMFNTFSCIEIEDDEFWLVSDMSIRCWSKDHQKYALGFGLPGIIIWGVLMPFICMLLIMKNNKNLADSSVRAKYGFLYNGYSSKYYYWEFVILYRKLSIICLSVFVGSISVPVQALTAITVLLIGLYFQSRNNPYENENLNEMELRSILVAVITIYCGLFYMSKDVNKEGQVLLFCLMLCVNTYFLLFWSTSILSSMKNLIRRIRKITRKSSVTGIFEYEDVDNTLSYKYSIKDQTRILSSKSINTYNSPRSEDSLIQVQVPHYKDMKDVYLSISKLKNHEIQVSSSFKYQVSD